MKSVVRLYINQTQENGGQLIENLQGEGWEVNIFRTSCQKPVAINGTRLAEGYGDIRRVFLSFW